jgi:hypothetical protein
LFFRFWVVQPPWVPLWWLFPLASVVVRVLLVFSVLVFALLQLFSGGVGV